MVGTWMLSSVRYQTLGTGVCTLFFFFFALSVLFVIEFSIEHTTFLVPLNNSPPTIHQYIIVQLDYLSIFK